MIVLCGLLVNPRSTVAAIVDVANQCKTAKLTATVIVVFVVTTAITKTHGEWFSPRRRRISPVNSDGALDFELFEIKNCPQTVACGVLRGTARLSTAVVNVNFVGMPIVSSRILG
ncbi:unnamed protein product [Brassica oleracea]